MPKETTMQYKTIVLELLQQNQELHERLRRERKLLATVNRLATELRDRHLASKEQLSQARPDSDPSQIASVALEIALKPLEDSLRSESPADGSEALSLDEAMAFVRRHTPPE
jgi:hypothetical protein